jgi:hypothetical protein
MKFRLTAVALLILVFVTSLFAGPPLLCHPFDIGNAKSLPLSGHGWALSGNENYDTRNLAQDTLALLEPGTPIIVRMETLRRATLYARKDPYAAKELLIKLHARATSAESSGHPDALAWFDVGYLAETYHQGLASSQNPAAGLDGYRLVKKALALRGHDAEMEFAAALITLHGPEKDHVQYAQDAMAGAKQDPLLARNLASHFWINQTQTVSEVLSRNISPTGVQK